MRGLTETQKAVFAFLEFTPSELQMPLLVCDARFLQLTGGVRAGKSTVLTKVLWSRRSWEGKKERFGLLGSDYRMTSTEFEYLSGEAATMGVLKEASKRVDPGVIELRDGTIIETLTGKDPAKIAMWAYDGIVICEAGQCDLQTYQRAQERVAEKRGWIAMGGTLESSLGWYAKLHQAWQFGDREHRSFSLPSWANTAVFPGGRQDPEILRLERELTEQGFMERVAGVPQPPKGLVFPEFRPDIHVRHVEWAPELPVYMWVDPGYSDACAYEFFQEVGGQLRGFYEIYERGKIATDIIDIMRRRP